MGIVIRDEKTKQEFPVPQEVAAKGGEDLDQWVKENTPTPMTAPKEDEDSPKAVKATTKKEK